tara:strand:+ start:742 stop:1134 length:393 start_codon:yes stop_codon:yes gene_type:complete
MRFFLIALLTSFTALADECTIGNNLYNLEIANTPEQRKIGLMNRKSMPEDNGMMFIWPQADLRAMWMKNTYIPLDMLFIKDDTVIGVIENTIPHDLTPRYIEKPVNKIIELNAGQVQKNNIAIGDAVKCN